jgi:hypothetical protein
LAAFSQFQLQITPLDKTRHRVVHGLPANAAQTCDLQHDQFTSPQRSKYFAFRSRKFRACGLRSTPAKQIRDLLGLVVKQCVNDVVQEVWFRHTGLNLSMYVDNTCSDINLSTVVDDIVWA